MDDVMQMRNTLKALRYRAERQVQNKCGKCFREGSDLAEAHSDCQQCRVAENMTGVCHRQAPCWGDTGTVSIPI